MTHLRFSLREYQAIIAICRSLNLNRCRSQALKRLIAESLAGDLAELAERIARLRGQEIQLLHEHLRGSRQRNVHDLTSEEVEMLAEAAGPLLCKARFIRPLKRILVQHFLDNSPELAAKLRRLSHTCFETLCEHVKLRSEGSS